VATKIVWRLDDASRNVWQARQWPPRPSRGRPPILFDGLAVAFKTGLEVVIKAIRIATPWLPPRLFDDPKEAAKIVR
jgi:hypothetical protein